LINKEKKKKKKFQKERTSFYRLSLSRAKQIKKNLSQPLPDAFKKNMSTQFLKSRSFHPPSESKKTKKQKRSKY